MKPNSVRIHSMTFQQQQPRSQSMTGQQSFTTEPRSGRGQIRQPLSGQRGQQMGGTLDQALSPEMQRGLQQFFEASKACEWCAEQCIDEGPEMSECLRLCRDVADIASMNARFISRDSVFGPELAQLFIKTAEECAHECSKHSHEHCQQCARALTQAIQTTQNMLNSFQSVGTQQNPSAQMQSSGAQF